MKDDVEGNNSFFYQQAIKLAKIGSWLFDVPNKRVYWLTMVHQLHETNPKTYIPEFESSLAFYREDFRKKIEEMVQQSIETGADFDFEAVIITKKKRTMG